MVGVSFLLSDTPSNIKQQILASPLMQQKVCKDHCDSYELCNKQTFQNCPKFTELTRYIVKYISVQPQMGNTVYPYDGTWQDQPEWYNLAYSIGMNKYAEIRKNKQTK